MAQSPSSYKKSSRGRRGKVRHPQRWTIIVTVLLVLTVFVAAGAYKSCVKSSGPTKSQSLSGKHYVDLEMTEGAPEGSVVKNYEGFTVSFNRRNKTPDWVGWELLASEANGEEPRSDRFWQDYGLDECPSPNDYKRSGYDKGHLCPAADQKWSASAMSDCFVMSNMAPQDHALNAGAWKTLEEKERLWAMRDSAIVIVAGPIYSDSDNSTIGNGVRVPSAFYKVLLAPYLDKPRAIGFVYPNMRAPGNMADYAMSVDDVEKISGLDFFANLPDDIENEVEKYFDFKIWNKR